MNKPRALNAPLGWKLPDPRVLFPAAPAAPRVVRSLGELTSPLDVASDFGVGDYRGEHFEPRRRQRGGC